MGDSIHYSKIMKGLIICQILLGTAFLGIAFWEAYVADTHEPIGHDYNDITIVAYYYTVAKCMLNIFSGLATYFDCLSNIYSTILSRSSSQTVASMHFLCVIVATVLYGIYYRSILHIYRMVIFWDIIILSAFIGVVALAKYASASTTTTNPNAALVHPVTV